MHLHAFGLAGLCLWTSAAIAEPGLAQQAQPETQERQQQGEQQGRRWRWDDWRRMASATPEEQRQMQVDWAIRMLVETYELSEPQQEQVRAEVETMLEEYRQSLGKDAKEWEQIRQDMTDFWSRHLEAYDRGEAPNLETRPWEGPEFRSLRRRMRELRLKHPFDWEGSVDRIEKLLPEDQAAKGRKRLQQWRQRRAEQRRLWRERRARRESAANERTTGDQPRPPVSVVVSEDDWAAYTAAFVTKFKFDEAQKAGALKALKEAQQRAAAMRRSQEGIREQVDREPDAAKRAKQLTALDEPLRSLFEELKSRLNNLVTRQQREAAAEQQPSAGSRQPEKIEIPKSKGQMGLSLRGNNGFQFSVVSRVPSI